MKKIELMTPKKYNFYAKQLLLLYPVLIVIGKIVRWTLMRRTLIGMSKGWGYVDPIINGEWSFELFGMDELSEGDIGQGDNLYTVMRVFWILWLKIPTDFVSFEVAITLTWGIFLFLVLCGIKTYVSLNEAVYIVLGVIVNSVYCFCLGKEVYQMLFFFVLYLVLHSSQFSGKSKAILSCFVILLSAMFFRTYYILILAFAFLFCFYIQLRKKYILEFNSEREIIPIKFIFKILVIMVLGYFIMITGLRLISGSLFARFRNALLYASAETSSSNTYMENILSGHGNNVIMITIEYALAFLRMMFPIELIKLGPKYWPYILYQIIISVGMIKAVRQWNWISVEQKIATTLFVGFAFASATFEVDFGAWIRHGAVTMPMTLIMMGICNKKMFKKQQI